MENKRLWTLMAMITIMGGFQEATSGMKTLLVIEPDKEQPRNSEGDIIQLKDGRLGLVYTRFREGTDDNAKADLAIRTSLDHGRTWSDDRILLPNEGGLNTMSVSLLRLKSGELLLGYLRKDSTKSCNLILRRSTDELETLGPPVRATLLDGYHVVNNDRVIQLSTGRLIVPAVLHTAFDESGKIVTESVREGIPFVYYSDDDGRSWKKDNTPISPTSERKLILQENGVVELKDGRLWMFMRTAHDFQYGCYSSDGGIHWSQPQPTRLASPVSPATIERIPWSGDLLSVWNDHSGAHPFPPGRRTPLCMAISQDEGQTWSRSWVIEDNPEGWYCYTSMSFVGEQLILSYCAGDKQVGGLNRLKVAAFSKEWLQGKVRQALAGNQADAPSPHLHSSALLQPVLDYGRSFINTKMVANSPRFWVESRCRISDPNAGTTREYHQCGSCKSENTFAEKDLFKEDNYDFLPIFSERELLIFRRHSRYTPRYREVRAVEDGWGGTILDLHTCKGRVLRNPQEVFEAMSAGKMMVGQTELRDEKTGRTAVLEYPIKTINWHRDKKIWQVDTGPVLLPDLSVTADEWAQTLELAYIAFRTGDWADFVVEQPTPIVEEGKKTASVYHYSGILHKKTRNVLIACD